MEYSEKPKMISPMITFCMALKNRSKRAAESVYSLLNATEGLPVELMICEDIGYDRLCLDGLRPHCPVTHWVVDTGYVWNRSLLLNFSFKRAHGEFLVSWDADFQFPQNFGNRLIDDIEKTDFEQKFIRIPVTEKKNGVTDGRTQTKDGEFWGGLYVYKTNKVVQMCGYDERFLNHGQEEYDFNDRYARHWKTKFKIIKSQGYVYHLAHSDKLQGKKPKANHDLLAANKKQNPIANIDKNWGESKLKDERNYKRKLHMLTTKDRSSDTILIIGNGQSTQQLVDYGFHNIPNTIDTFGMGAAYRYYEKIGWWPDFYGWLDRKTVTSHEENLRRIIEDEDVPVKKFLFSRKISKSPKLVVSDHHSTGDRILQIVAKMGYKKILLIGADCNYQERLPEAKSMDKASAMEFFKKAGMPFRKNHVLMVMTETPDENPNYFFSDYQQKGDVFSRPRGKKTHLPSWKNIARKYRRNKEVEIKDCSPISNLSFRRGNLKKELDKFN